MYTEYKQKLNPRIIGSMLSFSFSINDATFIIRNNSFVSGAGEYSSTEIHHHHVAEIHYIYAGSLSVNTFYPDICDKRTFSVSSGQVMLLPPNVYHETFESPDLLRLTFTVDVNAPASPSPFLKKLYEKIYGLDSPLIFDDEMLKYTFNILEDYAHGTCVSNDAFGSWHHRFLLTSAVSRIIDLILSGASYDRDYEPRLADDDREYLIKDFLNMRSPTRELLRDLADTLNLSQRQTQTVIERVMGKNFKSLVIEQNMQTAYVMIKCTDKSITSIAEKIGYNSYSSFFTAYKNYFGVTPNFHRSRQQQVKKP